MRQRFKANIERGNPPKGTVKIIVSLKDNGGGRWEFVGKTPFVAAKVMMALCMTGGKQQCMREGKDDGIEHALGLRALNK